MGVGVLGIPKEREPEFDEGAEAVSKFPDVQLLKKKTGTKTRKKVIWRFMSSPRQRPQGLFGVFSMERKVFQSALSHLETQITSKLQRARAQSFS